jgi:hypothetical protein
VTQLQLLELFLQLYLLSVGEIELLRKLLLLLQQLSEVPLFAGAGLNQLVVHAYLHSILVLLLIGIQILTVLYPASFNILQLLRKRWSGLENALCELVYGSWLSII